MPFETWQPIETAPQDRPILGWMPSGGPADAKGGAGLAIVQRDGNGWKVVHDYEDWWWAGYNPTHWMPLPTPPEQS